MKHTTTGLVLREVKTGEADRILSILTPSGIVSAAAKGALRPKNKLFSATGLYCYSEFTLFEGRTMYRVNEAAPIEVFFGLRESIEGIALASYMAEILQILSPTGTEAQVLLRLALNSLHMLAAGRRAPAFVKTVFELRSLSESGFMPDLLACAECGRYEGGAFCFDVRSGRLYCGACAAQGGRAPNLDAAALAALRHVVLSEDDKVFAFAIKSKSLSMINRISEDYVVFNLDYPPKTLAFLKTVLPAGPEDMEEETE